MTAERASAIGGIWLGLSVVARYASAITVLAAIAWFVAHRRWRLLATMLAGGMAVAILLAIVDWRTWGMPFHSFAKYVGFNVFSSKAADAFGKEGPGFYVLTLLTTVPIWAFVGLGFSLRDERPRLSLAWAMAGLYLLVLFVTPHKELRFLYPACVFFVVAAAPPWMAWLWRVQSQAVVRGSVVLASVLLGLATLLGFPVDLRGDQFRAIVRATRPAEVTGLLIVNEGLWGSGGYFYIGKNIPWWNCDEATDRNFRIAMGDKSINRVVTFEGRALDALKAQGFLPIEVVGRETILAR